MKTDSSSYTALQQPRTGALNRMALRVETLQCEMQPETDAQVPRRGRSAAQVCVAPAWHRRLQRACAQSRAVIVQTPADGVARSDNPHREGHRQQASSMSKCELATEGKPRPSDKRSRLVSHRVSAAVDL